MQTKHIISGVAVIVFCVGAYAWMRAESVENPQTEAQIARANNGIPTAAGVAPAASRQAVTATSQQAKQQLNAGIVAPPPESHDSSAAGNKPEKQAEMTPEEMLAIRQDLKETVETKFREKISFPLTETKMIAYAQTSLKVQGLNNKWDVQIAGADKDATAIEYNNLAVEEITKYLQSLNGLTIEEYNELTKLTTTDQEFNRIYQVYKQLILEGAIQPVALVKAPIAVPQTNPVPMQQVPVRAGTQMAPASAKPISAPVNPGTTPVTQGSPARPYSPQPSH